MMPSVSPIRPTHLSADRGAPATARELDRRAPRVIPREVRLAVLLNAHAKKVNQKVRERLADVVPSDDLFLAQTLEEAQGYAETILKRRYDTLLVGGGDGTLSTTINLLLRAVTSTSTPTTRHAMPDIGILRLGTGNGLANVSGAGDYLRDTTRLVEGQRPATMNLRLVQDVASGWVFPFASMGYDAQVLNDYVGVCNAARNTWAQSLAKGLPGYCYAIATRTIPSEMRSKTARVKVVGRGVCSVLDPMTDEEIPLERDGVLFEGDARAVLVGTTPFYGFGLKALPFAQRRSDRFHLRVSTASIGHLLAHLPKVWMGTHRAPEFIDFLCEGASIDTSEPLPLQMSGDARGATQHLEVALHRETFRLIEGSSKTAS